MTLLKDLIETSEKVRLTTRKKEKIALLANILRCLGGKETALACHYLSGQLPQGRLGVGWATLQEAQKDLAHPFRPVRLIEIDQLFEK